MEEEETSEEESTLRKELCNLSGDGGLTSLNGTIEPEHESICINHACRPITDLANNGDSSVRMTFRGIGGGYQSPRRHWERLHP